MVFDATGAGCYAVWDETFVLRGEHFLGETLTLQVRIRAWQVRRTHRQQAPAIARIA